MMWEDSLGETVEQVICQGELGDGVPSTTIRLLRRDLASGAVDALFFEPSYSPAAATGAARVWEGGLSLAARLAGPWRDALISRKSSRPVLELGSGLGLCGLVLAASGADVLLTDVQALAESLLAANVARNSTVDSLGAASSYWKNSRGIGGGSAAVAALDWRTVATPQLLAAMRDQPAADPQWPLLVVAAECLWLKELLTPLAATLATILHERPGSVAIVAHTPRAGEDPRSFAPSSALLPELEARGCSVRSLPPDPRAPKVEHFLVLLASRVSLDDLQLSAD